MTDKNTLSLCMVTKNDEEHISGCLKAFKEVADEIIIADMGSSDLTIDIARHAGAKVYQIECENNYSEAKNLCLEYAKGRWVLFLQANETISPVQLGEMKRRLSNPNAEGYLLYIAHGSEGDYIHSPVQSLRLLRNRKEYRYRYKAFERIPDELFNNIIDTDIQIVQKNSPSPAWDPKLRNLLLQEELGQYPEDCYLQYMYGIELLNQKKYEESITYFQKAYKTVNLDYLFAPHLYKCLSRAFIVLRKYTDALDVLKEGLKNFPFYTDLLILRGEVYKQLGRYGEAIMDMKSSLKIREQPASQIPGTEIDICDIMEKLGDIHMRVCGYQQALSCYKQAYEYNSVNEKLLYKIGKSAQRVNSAEVLETLLKKAIEKNNAGRLFTLMDVLFRQHEYIRVLDNLKYLELCLGKGEQTESIKYSCYMMLGRVQETKVYFSTINKESPLYSYTLLQLIESNWLYGRWTEAGLLLKEMEQLESIDEPIRILYKRIHELLAGKELCFAALSQQEYEIAGSLHENFLWAEQEKKAELLLPLLLKNIKEDNLIDLAGHWAERDNFQMIQMIFRHLSDKEKQIEFKQKILEQLLDKEYIETALKLMKLGDSQPLGPIENVLWSKSLMKKLKELVDKVYGIAKGTDGDVALPRQILKKQDRALPDFYKSLGAAGKRTDDGADECSDMEIVCDKIHEEIGYFYEKLQKRREALSAYLRALQWDPQNEPVQEIITNIFRNDPEQSFIFLEEQKWILEGSFFRSKQGFICFIHGLINFKNREFEQALASFSKISEEDAAYPVALSYLISSLWLMGQEEKAEHRLAHHRKAAEVVPSFFRICKGYILCRLDEFHQQYPYSDIILREKERVRSISL